MKVPESGGRVEKLRVQAAGSLVSGLHSVEVWSACVAWSLNWSDSMDVQNPSAGPGVGWTPATTDVTVFYGASWDYFRTSYNTALCIIGNFPGNRTPRKWGVGG